MPQATDPHNLQRFVEAQATIYPSVLRELRSGHKSGHWMWFIFPQIAGLGTTPTSRHFALRSRAEAEAYLKHPILGPRLRECTEILVRTEDRSNEEIFGSIDSMKFRSSMTLFGIANGDGDSNLFEQSLKKYFGGRQDEATLSLL